MMKKWRSRRSVREKRETPKHCDNDSKVFTAAFSRANLLNLVHSIDQHAHGLFMAFEAIVPLQIGSRVSHLLLGRFFHLKRSDPTGLLLSIVVLGGRNGVDQLSDLIGRQFDTGTGRIRGPSRGRGNQLGNELLLNHFPLVAAGRRLSLPHDVHGVQRFVERLPLSSLSRRLDFLSFRAIATTVSSVLMDHGLDDTEIARRLRFRSLFHFVLLLFVEFSHTDHGREKQFFLVSVLVSFSVFFLASSLLVRLDADQQFHLTDLIDGIQRFQPTVGIDALGALRAFFAVFRQRLS